MNTAVDKESNNIQQITTLSVSGISCAGCVGKIERSLSSVSGVTSCSVNLAEKTVHVESTVPDDELISAVASAGFEASLVISESENRQRQEERDRAELKRRKWHTIFALGLSAPLMGWMLIGGEMMVSPGVSQVYWGMVGLLTLTVLVISGGHFFKGFWNSLKNRSANMDTLVALGTGAAWLYSMAVVLFPETLPVAARHVYFEASAMIIGLINFGQMLELKGKGKTSEALKRLLNLQAPVARLVTDSGERDVPVETIRHGDRIRVLPGTSVAVDGIVVSGETLIDESMLTGEPIPVAKTIDDTVYAGTLNRNGVVVVVASKVGSETALARIIGLVKQAQNSKMPIARLADKVAAIFVPTVIVIALLAALIWLAIGPEPALTHALIVMVTVLIIACPCALGLATPMSVMVGVGKAAELGMLVRKGEALQTASKMTTIVLDKTATITEGRPKVTEIRALNGHSEAHILALAATLETSSEHPLAEAVIEAAKTRTCALLQVEGFSAVTGCGVQGTINGQQILLGNERLMTNSQVSFDDFHQPLSELVVGGQTVMLLAIDGQAAGLIAVADPIRQDSAAAIARLHRLGLKVVMLTGDNKETARAVAEQTGIDVYHARVLPEEKELHIRLLQEKGEVVGMTGDGINDAPALARADVGFAIGTGTDVAIEAADITLMRASLHGLADSIELSRATLRNIRQNLFGAFIYNTLGIPVAAGILYPLTGLLLNPMVAGAAMALSSVTVVSNANRLRLFKPAK